ncbi:uncharacterized protein ARMOST_06951 [Armillaria ostoyae]|uniref:Integrase catalytic domain-containing protein n=1 Tax=Armillaria ostoyae TaxID=47428 RepID=A0A284R4F4_ARMOS|nr:uncharacterized protein ARMOST_06951 [Armillaria ostoyae]
MLKHKPGTANVKANLLSRRSDHDQGEDNNGDITVLSPEHFRALIMPMTNETQEKVRTVTRQKELWDKGIAASLEHERGISEKNGILYYDNHVYIPHHTPLRGEIITQSHDHITAGHPGIAKTRELILQEYWWPKMKKDVETYIAGIILVPCNIKLSAEGWARILRDHIYARHGMQTVVISDWRPQFISQFMKELYWMLNITQNTSTTFHPQTNSQTERVNQEVKKYLRIFINH